VRLDTFLRAASPTPPVVVIHVGCASGLGVIRDLTQEGVPVLALDPDPNALGMYSRLAPGMVCPDPERDEEAFVSFLEELGRRLPQRAVVLPTHDEYIWPLSRHAERLSPWYAIPFSRWDVMERVRDKRAQMEAAWRCGVDTPKTVFIAKGDDLEAAAAAVPYPALLGPVESPAFEEACFRGAPLEVRTPADLMRIHPKVEDLGLLMLQERVPGGDDALFTVGAYLDSSSRPLAVFTGHELRRHPHGSGSCLVGISRWDQELADAGIRLLEELRCWGVSQVEFERDARDGRYYLMGVNPRHWTWHSLATACGVNLSYAAYRDAIGRPFVAQRQVDGLKWVAATEDVPLGLIEIARGRLDAGPWLRSYRGVRVRLAGVLTPRDPLPGIVNAGRVARRLVLRQRRGKTDLE
jgi:D-aspartate ligase